MTRIIEVSTFSSIPSYVPFGALYYTQDTGSLYIGTGNSVGATVTLLSSPHVAVPGQINLNLAPYYVSGSGATTTTSGSVSANSAAIPVADASSFSTNQGIYIAGAGSAGANYLGTVQYVSGNTITVSPVTSTTVSNAQVQHDETAAINAAVADLASGAINGTLRLPSGVCNLNGPLLQTGSANAVVPMPNITFGSATWGPSLAVAFEGAIDPPLSMTVAGNITITPHTQGTIIQTKASSGNLFGAKNTVDGGFGFFTAVFMRFKNITFRAVDNPGVTMVNASFGAGLSVEDCTFDTYANGAQGPPSQPTLTNGRAVITPSHNNWADSYVRHVQISGYYTGIEWGEHCTLDFVQINSCWNGVVVTAAAGSHAGYATRLLLQSTIFGLSATNAAQVFIGALEPEANGTPGWSVPGGGPWLIYDPSNFLTGVVNVTRSGVYFSKQGANSLNINLPPSSLPVLGNLFWSLGTIHDLRLTDDNSIGVAIGPQTCTIAFGPNPPAGANGLMTTGFNFTGKTVGVRVPVVCPADANIYTVFVIGNDNANFLQMYINNGNIAFQKRVAGSTTPIASIAYTTAAKLYLRFSESAGTITASYSADATTWTTLGTTTGISWAYTSTNIGVELGAVAAPASSTPGYSQFDQFFIGTPNLHV